MNKKKNPGITKLQNWFKKSVTYEEEPYTIDYEQALAVADHSLNTIVVARAGSGKTRTLVAKIIYLVARLKAKPEEIIAFVFNANAAREINDRLNKIRVNGKAIMNDAVVASTFHAFARNIVYRVCKKEQKCGKILAGEKEAFILKIVNRMIAEPKWRNQIVVFVKGQYDIEPTGERNKVIESTTILEEEEIERFAAMMTQFVNRAQQKYLGGTIPLGDVAKEYLLEEKVSERETRFIKLGVEVFRRYHWYLLNARKKLKGFSGYGTDFNLIVSWASQLVGSQCPEVVNILSQKQYILIDEYQDFSQLFLAAINAIRTVATKARLFVVGDDWQAINRFAGSDVEYFREFEKFFPDQSRRYEITTNYRCNKEIVQQARRFMTRAMDEKASFRAFSRKIGKVVTVNPKLTECELPLVKYDRRVSGRDLAYLEMTRRMLKREPKRKTVRYIKTLVELIRHNSRANEIMLLHRNNETNLEGITLEDLANGLKWGLEQLRVMRPDEFDEKIHIMTMHKSKGLEAEVVIILEADEGVIPKLHPDTLLYGLFGETEDISLADQKRLFYVAMTRAKKRLYIIHDDSNGPGFIKYLGKTIEKWET